MQHNKQPNKKPSIEIKLNPAALLSSMTAGFNALASRLQIPKPPTEQPASVPIKRLAASMPTQQAVPVIDQLAATSPTQKAAQVMDQITASISAFMKLSLAERIEKKAIKSIIYEAATTPLIKAAPTSSITSDTFDARAAMLKLGIDTAEEDAKRINRDKDRLQKRVSKLEEIQKNLSAKLTLLDVDASSTLNKRFKKAGKKIKENAKESAHTAIKSAHTSIETGFILIEDTLTLLNKYPVIDNSFLKSAIKAQQEFPNIREFLNLIESLNLIEFIKSINSQNFKKALFKEVQGIIEAEMAKIDFNSTDQIDNFNKQFSQIVTLMPDGSIVKAKNSINELQIEAFSKLYISLNPENKEAYQKRLALIPLNQSKSSEGKKSPKESYISISNNAHEDIILILQAYKHIIDTDEPRNRRKRYLNRLRQAMRKSKKLLKQAATSSEIVISEIDTLSKQLESESIERQIAADQEEARRQAEIKRKNAENEKAKEKIRITTAKNKALAATIHRALQVKPRLDELKSKRDKKTAEAKALAEKIAAEEKEFKETEARRAAASVEIHRRRDFNLLSLAIEAGLVTISSKANAKNPLLETSYLPTAEELKDYLISASNKAAGIIKINKDISKLEEDDIAQFQNKSDKIICAFALAHNDYVVSQLKIKDALKLDVYLRLNQRVEIIFKQVCKQEKKAQEKITQPRTLKFLSNLINATRAPVVTVLEHKDGAKGVELIELKSEEDALKQLRAIQAALIQNPKLRGQLSVVKDPDSSTKADSTQTLELSAIKFLPMFKDKPHLLTMAIFFFALKDEDAALDSKKTSLDAITRRLEIYERAIFATKLTIEDDKKGINLINKILIGNKALLVSEHKHGVYVDPLPVAIQELIRLTDLSVTTGSIKTILYNFRTALLKIIGQQIKEYKEKHRSQNTINDPLEIDDILHCKNKLLVAIYFSIQVIPNPDFYSFLKQALLKVNPTWNSVEIEAIQKSASPDDFALQKTDIFHGI